MILKNIIIVIAVCILLYAKNAIYYCVSMLSRDSIFNYIIDRKTLINTLFCVDTEYTDFISPKNEKNNN